MRTKAVMKQTLLLMRKELNKHQHGETATDAQTLADIELLVNKLSEFVDVEIPIEIGKASGKAK